ncbi:hypothetical protein ACU61A_41040 [Pseudonocardia sichuanensis]
MARRTNRHPVAVVVFVNAEGIDAGDAINVAEQIVAQHLHAARGRGGELVVETRAGQRALALGQTVELGRAVRAGLVGLATSPDAYTP